MVEFAVESRPDTSGALRIGIEHKMAIVEVNSGTVQRATR